MNLRYKKITIKIGSNVLTKPDGTLNVSRIAHLVDQIAQLKKLGVEIILVSSGAVAAGRSELNIDRKLDTVSARQLYSAVGQVKLINRYADLFQEYQITCAQVLTTKENFSDRYHYLNMKNCVSTLIENEVLPIVNENDTISISELMFTDNDELSGMIASMQGSEALIILTNVDGIYDGNPTLSTSKVIEQIQVNQKSWMKNIMTDKSDFGRGGMLTKSTMAQKLAKEGIDVHIANGLHESMLLSLLDADQDVKHTTFIGTERKSSNVKKWLAHSDSFTHGALVINEGARTALFSDRATSLLLIGVQEIRGSFRKNDILKIMDEKGEVLGWGRAQFDSSKVAANMRHEKPIIHYDYLFLKEL
ncbi:MAG: glutamate 5-kinase [Mangrovibacterium sp.]